MFFWFLSKMWCVFLEFVLRMCRLLVELKKFYVIRNCILGKNMNLGVKGWLLYCFVFFFYIGFNELLFFKLIVNCFVLNILNMLFFFFLLV